HQDGTLGDAPRRGQGCRRPGEPVLPAVPRQRGGGGQAGGALEDAARRRRLRGAQGHGGREPQAPLRGGASRRRRDQAAAGSARAVLRTDVLRHVSETDSEGIGDALARMSTSNEQSLPSSALGVVDSWYAHEMPRRPRLLSYVGRWARARRWLPTDARVVVD